jgi:Tfp pilus assembly protein PilN
VLKLSELNFFSTYNRESKTSRDRLIIITIIFLAFLTFTAGAYLVSQLFAEAIRKDVNSMQVFLNSTETREKLNQVELEKMRLELMNKYFNTVAFIQSGIDRRDFIKSSLLNTINTTLPADMVLKTISIAQDSIQLQGTAPGWVSVAELEHNLNALGIFLEVHVTDIQSDAVKVGKCTFNAQCRLKDVVKK